MAASLWRGETMSEDISCSRSGSSSPDLVPDGLSLSSTNALPIDSSSSSRSCARECGPISRLGPSRALVMLGRRDMPADAMLARSPSLPTPNPGEMTISSIPSLSLSLSLSRSRSLSSVAKSAPPSDGSGEAPGRTLVPTS